MYCSGSTILKKKKERKNPITLQFLLIVFSENFFSYLLYVSSLFLQLSRMYFSLRLLCTGFSLCLDCCEAIMFSAVFGCFWFSFCPRSIHVSVWQRNHNEHSSVWPGGCEGRGRALGLLFSFRIISPSSLVPSRTPFATTAPRAGSSHLDFRNLCWTDG